VHAKHYIRHNDAAPLARYRPVASATGGYPYQWWWAVASNLSSSRVLRGERDFFIVTKNPAEAGSID